MELIRDRVARTEMETADSDVDLLSVEQWHCDFHIGLSGRWNNHHFRQKFCLWPMLLGNRTDFSGDGCGRRGSTGERTENFILAESNIVPKVPISETYSETSNDVQMKQMQ